MEGMAVDVGQGDDTMLGRVLVPQLTYTERQTPRTGVALLFSLIPLREVAAMRNRRLQFSDRRYKEDMSKVPFKDGNGATIHESRRRIPDRRIANLQSDWIDTEWIEISQ